MSVVKLFSRRLVNEFQRISCKPTRRIYCGNKKESLGIYQKRVGQRNNGKMLVGSDESKSIQEKSGFMNYKRYKLWTALPAICFIFLELWNNHEEYLKLLEGKLEMHMQLHDCTTSMHDRALWPKTKYKKILRKSQKKAENECQQLWLQNP